MFKKLRVVVDGERPANFFRQSGSALIPTKNEKVWLKRRQDRRPALGASTKFVRQQKCALSLTAELIVNANAGRR